jgi:hypothetical protein
MKKAIVASLSAVALMGLAACSDSADGTTTQSTTPPVENPDAPAVTPAPESGTGGETQATPEPAQPAEPAANQ